MKALSLTQPMAWAIFHGKEVENRTWSTKYRGRIYIHASKKFDINHYRWLLSNLPLLNNDLPQRDAFTYGAIIGEVTVVDVANYSNSGWWFPEHFAWILENPVEYENPIPFKGSLGLWEKGLDVLDKTP